MFSRRIFAFLHFLPINAKMSISFPYHNINFKKLLLEKFPFFFQQKHILNYRYVQDIFLLCFQRRKIPGLYQTGLFPCLACPLYEVF